MKKFLGITLIILSIIVTINFFVLSKESFSLVLTRPLLSLSQLASLVGTILLCFSFITASRALFLESWFGGLDKVYKTHQIIGAISFVLLLSHPMFLIANYLPNRNLALSFIFPGANWANNFGIFALWIMIVIIFFTIYVKLPIL
ncbi:MAG: ferric reductase-like transmembrane domain-containing protein, partial [Actinobacteria bacterium]|nr:ferric reductase-like transmembrane domain-containing protein [Actinomycetota bacterium]